MNIKGTYVIYEDGKEVLRQDNLLTKFGKRFITSYLAGAVSFNNKDIAIGIGSTAPSIENTRLDFEFYRSAVNLGSIDIQTDKLTGNSTYSVVFKTTVPVDVAGVISELGLFPTETFGNKDYSSRYISSFENPINWFDSSGLQPSVTSTPSPTIGSSWFEIDAAQSGTKEYFINASFDLSGYTINDGMSLAFRQKDANLDYVFARFYSSDTDYYEIRFTGNSSIGNRILSVSLNDLFNSGHNSGTPVSDSITKISVGAKAKSSGATSVLLDGLRINDEDNFNPIYGLISRSVLSTPITKQFGKQMDIEYRLGLTF